MTSEDIKHQLIIMKHGWHPKRITGRKESDGGEKKEERKKPPTPPPTPPIPGARRAREGRLKAIINRCTVKVTGTVVAGSQR